LLDFGDIAYTLVYSDKKLLTGVLTRPRLYAYHLLRTRWLRSVSLQKYALRFRTGRNIKI